MLRTTIDKSIIITMIIIINKIKTGSVIGVLTQNLFIYFNIL
jgi:hypothetical protein